MARILKRPMFNRGGSSNQGIMDGLVDRTGYANGSDNQSYKDMVMQKAKANQEILDELAPVPKTSLGLGQIGSNLVMGAPFKEALAKGYSDYVSRDDARLANMANINRTSVGAAMQSVDKERAENAKNNSTLAIRNNIIGRAIQDDNYDLPEAQRIADYQLTTKTALQDKVGRNRLGGLIDFDIADQKQMKDRLPTLKNKVGMYFFDPYDGQIKLLTNKNGVLGFESFNSVGEINFAEPDVGSATIELEPQQDIFSPEIDDASP